MKRKQGISLIVLSITILVMVILASAALITLENSGIIGRSKTALSKQQLAEEMTRLTVIKNGVLTDNLGEITVAEYIAELDRKGIIDGTTKIDEYGSTVVKTMNGVEVYIRQNGEDNLTISFEQIVKEPDPPKPLGELITAADYGKSINYTSDNGITEWQIFYHTSDNVYIIAKEMLSYSMVNSLSMTGATKLQETVEDSVLGTRTVGLVHWLEVPSGTSVASDAKTKWMAEWSRYSGNPNLKCISYFLNETIWKGFKNTTASYASYVKGAIGTPTGEMFVASYNAKRLAEKNTTKVPLALTANGTGGYDINGSTYTDIGDSDSLYTWTTATSNGSIWLASPSSAGTNVLFYVYGGSGGRILCGNYLNMRGGFRPVVCLSADILAQLGTTTDYVI